MTKTKPNNISKEIVYQAWKDVKRNRGSYGIDRITIEEYEKDLKNRLYKLWNRMSSGSYFPKAVRRVEIPKADGKTRALGIPTVEDRIAQTVVVKYVEPILEKIFSRNSYGYRPGKSQHQALRKAREMCWKYDYVLDIDIKGFFDNISHEKLMRAVRKHVKDRWMVVYIERWLKSPVELKDGSQEERDRGTPQGGVISPLLANLFLHYAMDTWLENEYPKVEYERFADDAIIHCRTEKEAKEIWGRLAERFKECELELHPEKTKIAYCRDANRRKEYPVVSFTFLGFDFRPREAINYKGRVFLNFLPAVSQKAKKKLGDSIREMKIQRYSVRSLEALAEKVNEFVRGAMNYYGIFYQSAMYGILFRIDYLLRKWSMKKHKGGMKASERWFRKLYKNSRELFVHWKYITPKYAMHLAAE